MCDEGVCTGCLPLIQLGKFGDCNYIQQLCKGLTLSKLHSGTTAGNITQMCVCRREMTYSNRVCSNKMHLKMIGGGGRGLKKSLTLFEGTHCSHLLTPHIWMQKHFVFQYISLFLNVRVVHWNAPKMLLKQNRNSFFIWSGESQCFFQIAAGWQNSSFWSGCQWLWLLVRIYL